MHTMRVVYNFDWLAYLAAKDMHKYERARARLIRQEAETMHPDTRQRALAVLWAQEMRFRNMTGTARYNQVVAEFWQMVGKFQSTLRQV